MLSIVTYLAVFLLVYAGGTDHRDPRSSSVWRAKNPTLVAAQAGQAWDQGINKPRSIKIRDVMQEIVSPATVVEVLDRYQQLVQSPTIRANFRLRAAKGQPTNSTPFHGATDGEWWERRRPIAAPKDSMWFDGTLTGGLIDIINATVDYRVPQLLSVRPGWFYDMEKEEEQLELPPYIADLLFPGDEEDGVQAKQTYWGFVKDHMLLRFVVVTNLHRHARLASESLRAAEKAQQLVLNATIRAVEVAVSRTRKLAKDLEETESVYYKVLDELDERLSQESFDPYGSIWDRILGWSSSRLQRKWRQWFWSPKDVARRRKVYVEEQRKKLASYAFKVVASHYSGFLRRGDSSGSAVRYYIRDAYGNLKRGITITDENIETKVKAVLDAAIDELNRLQDEEEYKQKKEQERGREYENMRPEKSDEEEKKEEKKRQEERERERQEWEQENRAQNYHVVEVSENLDRMARIRKVAGDLVASGENMASRLEGLVDYRWAEAAAAMARVNGLEPQESGQPVAGKLVVELDESGAMHGTQFRYEYWMTAPRAMAAVIRAKADELEFVWQSILSCENDLAYLNICESTKLAPEEKEKLVREEFLRRTGVEGEPSTCDELGNPLHLRDVCKEYYLP
ncbi:hypothetical protein F4677DRAFT_465470 [Hypoxylon crocopeplum]|nr:hypothetical protein F4677DRAFT_465470 [Hypoxylon crocopeplum]